MDRPEYGGEWGSQWGVGDHLLQDLSLAEALRRTQRDTRRFARKQRTWMRQLGFPRIDDAHLEAVRVAGRQAFAASGEPPP